MPGTGRKGKKLAGTGAGTEGGPERKFIIGLSRAFGGSLIFNLPLLMTMEMWALGFYTDRLRLMIFLSLSFPMLVLLSYHAGFEKTSGWAQDIFDALTAYAVGFITAAIGLALTGIIRPEMSPDEIVGKISLQAIPGGIGAILARSLLGAEKAREKEKTPVGRYGGEIFLMAVGALFLAFNVAPTEEVVLISSKTSSWHFLFLAMISIAVMHAFVYVLEFRGQHEISPGSSFLGIFFRFTLVGYAVVLVICLFVLWVFGRTDGISFRGMIEISIVLSVPASVGAAAARLIL